MAKSAKNTVAGSEYLAEQDEKLAMQIDEVLFFFHSEVLHGFVSLTMLRSLVVIILRAEKKIPLSLSSLQ